MFGNSGSTGFSQIDANIEAVRFDGRFEDAFGLDGGFQEAMTFFFIKLLNISNFTVRKHKEMTSVIWVPVHQDECIYFSRDDQAGFIVIRFG